MITRYQSAPTYTRKNSIKLDIATNRLEAVDKRRTSNFHLVLVRPYFHIVIFTFFIDWHIAIMTKRR